MTTESRREFEEYLKDRYSITTIPKTPSGERYLDPEAVIAWEAWQAARERQWMPIETAPHDKATWVIVVEKDGDTHIAIFDNHPLYTEDDEMGMCWTDGHMELRPTHWMPLPNPPTSEKI